MVAHLPGPNLRSEGKTRPGSCPVSRRIADGNRFSRGFPSRPGRYSGSFWVQENQGLTCHTSLADDLPAPFFQANFPPPCPPAVVPVGEIGAGGIFLDGPNIDIICRINNCTAEVAPSVFRAAESLIIDRLPSL